MVNSRCQRHRVAGYHGTGQQDHRRYSFSMLPSKTGRPDRPFANDQGPGYRSRQLDLRCPAGCHREGNRRLPRGIEREAIVKGPGIQCVVQDIGHGISGRKGVRVNPRFNGPTGQRKARCVCTERGASGTFKRLRACRNGPTPADRNSANPFGSAPKVSSTCRQRRRRPYP